MVYKSEKKRDATAYLNSLETTPAEREFLRDQINELLNMRDYEWGPRSAHVASKKYLLFKTLWFQAELATGPRDLTDAERLELVEAFFLTMKESLDKQIRMALDEESRVEQMRKLAEYVV
jgi:hypothetical protein